MVYSRILEYRRIGWTSKIGATLMSAEFAAIAGYLIAAAMMCIAFFTWRKAVSLHHLLVEAANRFEAGRRRNKDLELELQQVNEKLELSRETGKRLEKATEELRQKSKSHSGQMQQIEKGYKSHIDELQRNSEHLEAQVNAMITQVSQARRDQRLAEDGLRKLQKDFDDKLSKQETTWQKRLQDQMQAAKNEHRDLLESQQKIVALERQLQHADPLMLKRLKRKVSNLEHLLSSMRGLRELAEERNQNWEVALRHLAAWVLRQQGKKVSENMQIGGLVGTALEAINERLVDDDFDAEPAKDWHDNGSRLDAEKNLSHPRGNSATTSPSSP